MSLGTNPAYPHPGQAIDADYYQNYGYSGMTIRQRYAMAAMQGMLSDDKTSSTFAAKSNGWAETKEKIVWAAFQLADAMIAFEEREHEEDIKKRKERAEKFGEGLHNALRNQETQESKGV